MELTALPGQAAQASSGRGAGVLCMLRRKCRRMTMESSPAKIEAAGMLSQIPFRPRGQSNRMSAAGKRRAVVTEMRDACTGLSTAVIKL